MTPALNPCAPFCGRTHRATNAQPSRSTSGRLASSKRPHQGYDSQGYGTNTMPAELSSRLADLQVMTLCVQPGTLILLVERVYLAHLLDWMRTTAVDL